jgi:hypothetical protein
MTFATLVPSPYADQTRFAYRTPTMAERMGADPWLLGLANTVHLLACVLLAIHALGETLGLVFGAGLVLYRMRPTVLLTTENITGLIASPGLVRFARLEHTIGHTNRRRRIASKQLQLCLKTYWPVAFVSVEDELSRMTANGLLPYAAPPGPAIVIAMSSSTLHLASAQIDVAGRVAVTDAVPLATFPVNEVLHFNRTSFTAACTRLREWAPPTTTVVVLGLPATINPGGRWFPDTAPRCSLTTLKVLAEKAREACVSRMHPPAGGVQVDEAIKPVVTALLDHLADAL